MKGAWNREIARPRMALTCHRASKMFINLPAVYLSPFALIANYNRVNSRWTLPTMKLLGGRKVNDSFVTAPRGRK